MQKHFLIIYPATNGDKQITLREVLARNPVSIYNLNTLVRTNLVDGSQRVYRTVPSRHGPIPGGLNVEMEHYICTQTIDDALDLVRSRQYKSMILHPAEYY